MRLTELRRIFRLATALHAPRVDHATRLRYLVATFHDLIGSRAGCVWLARDVLPGLPLRCIDIVDHGWPAASERHVYRSFLRGGPVGHPLEPVLRAAQYPAVVTRSRDQLMSDDKWYRLPYVTKTCRAAGVDQCLYSVAAHPRPGWVSVIELYRAWGDARAFTKAQRRLVRLIHGEVAWLHEQHPAYQRAVSGASLTPRLTTVLSALLEGLSEKQIAEKLKLSYHTVHTQVGMVYHRFGVHSRAELLARHLSGGDRAHVGIDLPELPRATSARPS